MIELKVVNFDYSELELLIIPVCENIDVHINNIFISRLVKIAKKMANFKGKNGELVTIFCPQDTTIKRVIFFGIGNLEEVNSNTFRSFAGKITTHCIENFNTKDVMCAMPSVDKFQVKMDDIFYSVMEGFFLKNHIFDTYKKEKDRTPLSRIVLAVSEKKYLFFANLISKAEIICKGTILARQWINMPSNHKKPCQFAKLIKNSSDKKDLNIDIFDDEWLDKNKFGAMLAVGQGSSSKSCLVSMEYKPIDFQKTVLLVGKGVTFDSGGINLKPSIGLDEMKTDMSGAAAVAGTLIAISKLKPSIRVIGILPLVENMPSGSAMCPGDIVNTFSGKTVEVMNTDAEGRLILVDALSWGIDKYQPDFIVDIATLTGACVIALGEKIAGVFSTNEYLLNSILTAGEKRFERCWHMPIPDDYRKLLKSDIADLSNISSSKWGGAITAAAFLSEFVGQVPWAHIDIAGPARSKKKTDYCDSGATGFGVRLLCELIENLF